MKAFNYSFFILLLINFALASYYLALDNKIDKYINKQYKIIDNPDPAIDQLYKYQCAYNRRSNTSMINQFDDWIKVVKSIASTDKKNLS